MKLVLISDEVKSESELNLINRFFSLGLEVFHLRKPDFSKEEMISYIEGIHSSYRNRIVIHSYPELVNEFKLKGVNCNKVTKGRQNISFYSASCHSFDEIERLDSDSVQYVLLSPVFDSVSKNGYNAAFKQEDLKESLEQMSNTKIIALGGITPDKIDTCADLGFDGVAVLGAVWRARNPEKEFINLIEKCKAYDHMY